jgi:hypothetical protein
MTIKRIVKYFLLTCVAVFLLALGIVGAKSCSVLNAEKVRRAQATYERGEVLFKQGYYRKAMWEYQEVGEFYKSPRTQWAELAEEKEWVCRAFLNDWTPITPVPELPDSTK